MALTNRPFTPVRLESPFKGKTKEENERNVRYARACMRNCLMRSEAPFASHLLYTQPGVLDDNDPDERALGIAAGLSAAWMFRKVVVYTDLGISEGMKQGIRQATKHHQAIEYRTLPDWTG